MPEITQLDKENVEHQLLLLAREVILPLATKSSALVLGSEQCSLTRAFIKVAFATQRKLKDTCPFTLVIFARAPYFDLKARNVDSVVSHFRQKGSGWEKNDTTMKLAMQNKFGDDECYWPEEDLHEGRYSLVMFESLTGDAIDTQTPDNFQNIFVSALTHVPVIAMMTYGTDKCRYHPVMADHVRRGMPLMLLDSRKREVHICINLCV